jgi:PAS domain S-box-containing protein
VLGVEDLLEPIRILIADDHEAVRKGVRSLLSAHPDWQVCGEAVDGEDAVKKAKSLHPDLVLMDVSMPRMDGIEAARIIRRDLQKIQVIIVSQNDPATVGRQAAEVDARGHVPKADLAEQLIPTIEQVMAEREKPPVKITRSAEEEFRILERVGATLASELDLQKIVQAATDAGRELSEAEFGAFFYNVIDNSGEKYMLYTLSGVPREAFSKFPMPRKTEVFGPTFDGTGTLRLDDVTKDSRYGKNAPYYGKPPGHLPVRSYLAVSVVSRSGEVHGGLFYGHSKPGVFTERAERLVEGIARQAAIAIDNARLLETAERAKAEAQANAEQLRMALNASRTVAWSWDLKTGEISHSANSVEVLGMPTSFHVSTGWKNVFPEDLAAAESIVNRAIAECSEYQLDYRMVHGHTRKILWLHNRGKVECDASGKAVRLTGTTTDITERKLVEETTGLMAAIVDSSDDAVISKTLNGIITSWNKSAELLFGHTADEAIGKHITLIIPPERHQEETSIIERLKRGERIEHFETVRMRKNGSRLDISLTVSPVRDSDGRVVGASKVARDISEKKRIAQTLRESEQRYQVITDAIPVMIWMAGLDKRCYYFNKCWLDFVGRSLEEEYGNGWTENIHPDDFERCLQIYMGSFDARRPFEMQYRLKHHTGRYRWILDHGVPRYSPDGTFEGYVGGCLDIHDQKEGEEKARRADVSLQLLRSQDEERRHIARELHDSAGQTLAVLGMNLAHIAQLADTSGPKIKTVAQETQELVDQLSQEIRTTSYLLHPPLLDENGLADALGLYLRGLAERSGLEIEVNIPGDFGRLHRDVELVLFRLVQECLTNVHRHSESKMAAVHISQSRDAVTLVIRDEGKGISRERLEEIQTENSSGVGIRGMRERVRQFGGEMKIESNGVGTKISFTLPIHVPAAKKLESFADSRL